MIVSGLVFILGTVMRDIGCFRKRVYGKSYCEKIRKQASLHGQIGAGAGLCNDLSHWPIQVKYCTILIGTFREIPPPSISG